MLTHHFNVLLIPRQGHESRCWSNKAASPAPPGGDISHLCDSGASERKVGGINATRDDNKTQSQRLTHLLASGCERGTGSGPRASLTHTLSVSRCQRWRQRCLRPYRHTPLEPEDPEARTGASTRISCRSGRNQSLHVRGSTQSSHTLGLGTRADTVSGPRGLSRHNNTPARLNSKQKLKAPLVSIIDGKIHWQPVAQCEGRRSRRRDKT